MEVVTGNATTDFGAPAVIPQLDRVPTTAAQANRLALLVDATWVALDEAVAAAPPTLRKGPRGGGRDRDAVAKHCLAAEVAYARKLGVRPQGAGPRRHRGEVRLLGADAELACI